MFRGAWKAEAGSTEQVSAAALNARLFLLEAPSQVERLQQAIRRKDSPDTAQRANRLKTNAMRVGAAAVRDDAWRIELVARQGDLECARSLLKTLRGDVRKVSDRLSETLYS